MTAPKNAQRHDMAMLTALTAKGVEFLAAMDSNPDNTLALLIGAIDNVEHTFNAATDLMRFAAQRGLEVGCFAKEKR